MGILAERSQILLCFEDERGLESFAEPRVQIVSTASKPISIRQGRSCSKRSIGARGHEPADGRLPRCRDAKPDHCCRPAWTEKVVFPAGGSVALVDVLEPLDIIFAEVASGLHLD